MCDELYKVMTFSEASEKWKLSESTLRRAIGNPKRLKKGVDYRKSGSVWIIKKSSMERLYGKLEESKENE